MKEELRRILGGFYSTAPQVEKEITDAVWMQLYNQLFMPIYEKTLEKIETKGLSKVSTNPNLTAKQIYHDAGVKLIVNSVVAKMKVDNL